MDRNPRFDGYRCSHWLEPHPGQKVAGCQGQAEWGKSPRKKRLGALLRG